MKPSVAFAIGLWVGGLVGGGVGLLYAHLWQSSDRGAVAQATAEKHAAELEAVQQENARLAAETHRLEQTITELKEATPPAPPPEPTPRRRVPFRHEDGLAAARRLAQTVETDPKAVEQLQALFANPQSDPAVLIAAVESLSRPAAGTQPDLEGRVALLADLAEATSNADVRARIQVAQEELAKRWMDEGGGGR